MADARADALIKRRDRLKGERASHEALWQELAAFVLPLRADFTVRAAAPGGTKRGQELFDGTAGQAARNLGSGLYGLVTNPANQWFTVRHEVEELNEIQEVAVWLDTVTRTMRNALLSRGLGFYSRLPGLYEDLATFGTAVFYVDESPGAGLRFSHRHLAECLLDQSADEQIDTVIRSCSMTARQAVQRFGDAAGRIAIKAIDKGEFEQRIAYIHAVMPREDADPRRRDAKGKRFASLWIAEEERQMVAEAGYDSMPFMCPRWSTAQQSLYGDPPALLALPDAKMINQMSKTGLVAAHKAIDPPLLAVDELAMRGVQTRPGAIIYGGLDPMSGNPLVRPLNTGAQVGFTLEMEEQRRNAVRDAFFYSLLVMVGQPNRTATEVLEAQEEKLRLMAPHLGRLQAEFLDPLLDREFDILFRAGAFPPAPDVVQQYGNLKVEYVSPLARAAKTSEAASVLRTLEAVTPLAATDPSVLDNFDSDAIARGLAEAYSLPPKMMRDRRAVDELRAGRAQAQQQAQQQQQLMAAAGAAAPAARAMRDMAQAQRISQPEAP